MNKIRKRSKIVWIFFIILALIIVSGFAFISQPSFGKLSSGARLERIKQSPNYVDGKFQNLSPTIQITSDKSFVQTMLDFWFVKNDSLRPKNALPSVKTDLHKLPENEDTIIWLGHSAFYLNLAGKKILVDPSLVSAAPLGFLNAAFAGTDVYTPEDIPNIDYLLITHDHWDHLDYKTIMAIKEKVGKVVCGLGVGAHLEAWGFNPIDIIELDWQDNVDLDNTLTIYALPAKHFSGRFITRNQSLWVSFMIQSSDSNIFVSGDTGYDAHFMAIKKQFPNIDLAIIENGQYNVDWQEIHTMPDELPQVMQDIGAKKFFAAHNSKYSISVHSWFEPLNNAYEAAKNNNFSLITPMIGEIISIKNDNQVFTKWWENIS